MGIGEAAVTVLSDRGVPTPVVHTRLAAPAASMGPAPDVDGAAKASPLYARYGERLDNRSAREILAERLRGAEAAAARRAMEHVPAAEAAPKAPKRRRRAGGGHRRLPQLARGQAAAERGHARRVRDAAQAAVRPVPPFTEAHEALRAEMRGVRGGRAAAARAGVGGGALVPERGVREAGRARLARAEVRAGRRLGRRRRAVRGARALPARAGSRRASARTSGSPRRRSRRSAPRRSRQRWLAPAIRGEKIAALAITEPDTGSDVAAIRTRAEQVDGGWVVNGAKTFITNGVRADFYVTAVAHAAGARPRRRSRSSSSRPARA